jgi:F-type H+-transporting ATPase subunit epsilon
MQLEVVTPAGQAVSAEVDEVTVPGAVGEFGVLPGHTPFLTALRPGLLSWRGRASNGALVIGTGFCEVTADSARVVVLTQSATKPEAATPAIVK